MLLGHNGPCLFNFRPCHARIYNAASHIHTKQSDKLVQGSHRQPFWQQITLLLYLSNPYDSKYFVYYISFCFQTPHCLLRQLICCPDTKLSGKACLSSCGVESCWEKCGLMDSGWSGEHWGACWGINVYVLVAFETEDTALMLAACEVLKNRASSPQTSHYRSDDGMKHEARLNEASGLRGFQGLVIKRCGIINQVTAFTRWCRRGTEAQGTRILPSKSPYFHSLLHIFSHYSASSCRAPLSWSLQQARGLSKWMHEESYCFLAVHMPREQKRVYARITAWERENPHKKERKDRKEK